MVEENISQEFRFKNVDETRNCFLEEMNQNELMSKSHEKVCTTLNSIEHFLILASTITEIYFNFYFCLFDWYYYRNYKFCNKIKNLCNSCRNEKV